MTAWQRLEKGFGDIDFFDGLIHYELPRCLPEGSQVLLGNSLPVRQFEEYARGGKSLHIYGNRGASGIDGNVSTAFGLQAFYPDKPTFAILGDLTFYHDMNGLYAAQAHQLPLKIILLNNGGGGIFQRLPIAKFEEFQQYFFTPQDFDFRHAAALYGLILSGLLIGRAFRLVLLSF
ncbi:MAG: thiamine pyrophosphate-binding protein [Deinococcales bacterium]